MVWAAALLALGVAARWCGGRRWRRRGDALRRRLTGAVPSVSANTCAAPLDGLPAPVQRWFGLVLPREPRIIATARLEHVGVFNLQPVGERWRRFRSTQLVTTAPRGFLWDAAIAALPGVQVLVHDGYVVGEGILTASLQGLAPLADERGPGELARGELLRWLAEAVGWPTALLPGRGVQWTPVDAQRATATLRDAGHEVALEFEFGDDGMVAAVRCAGRGRAVGHELVPTPWEGRWWGQQVVDGMRLPRHGEVAWLLPEGPQCYWRARITGVDYTFVGEGAAAGNDASSKVASGSSCPGVPAAAATSAASAATRSASSTPGGR